MCSLCCRNPIPHYTPSSKTEQWQGELFHTIHEWDQRNHNMAVFHQVIWKRTDACAVLPSLFSHQAKSCWMPPQSKMHLFVKKQSLGGSSSIEWLSMQNSMLFELQKTTGCWCLHTEQCSKFGHCNSHSSGSCTFGHTLFGIEHHAWTQKSMLLMQCKSMMINRSGSPAISLISLSQFLQKERFSLLDFHMLLLPNCRIEQVSLSFCMTFDWAWHSMKHAWLWSFAWGSAMHHWPIKSNNNMLLIGLGEFVNKLPCNWLATEHTMISAAVQQHNDFTWCQWIQCTHTLLHFTKQPQSFKMWQIEHHKLWIELKPKMQKMRLICSKTFKHAQSSTSLSHVQSLQRCLHSCNQLLLSSMPMDTKLKLANSCHKQNQTS